jgi:hypothetical protein
LGYIGAWLIPFSPWQPAHKDALSAPAVASPAACADVPKHSITTMNVCVTAIAVLVMALSPWLMARRSYLNTTKPLV